MPLRLAAALALLLTLALTATAEPPAVPVVPAPRAATLADLPDRPFNWALALSKDDRVQPLAFSVDLDLLAPLGTGERNAATYFVAFAKQGGSRLPEWEQAQARMVTWSRWGTELNVLPGDDPLLLEAEPWLDQASCRFYPELLPLEGWQTRIPNLLQAIALGRSWVARGFQQQDPALAREDFRRVIRFGRLLMQDDVTLIQNLVGLALVRMGTDSLYDLARGQGDGVVTTLGALVAADANSIRLACLLQVRTQGDLTAYLRPAETELGRRLELPDPLLARVVKSAREAGAQALRMEAMMTLKLALHLGTEAQQELVRQTLEELSHDPAPTVAATARYLLGSGLDRTTLDEMLQPSAT